MKNKIGMEAFDVVAQANEGIKVELSLPDGSDSGHWLTVLGADSKAFRSAQAKIQRKQLAEFKGKRTEKIDPAEAAEKREKYTREAVASLVADWSFEEKCTLGNVIKFFETAPQIQDQVDSVAGDRKLFFKMPSKV